MQWVFSLSCYSRIGTDRHGYFLPVWPGTDWYSCYVRCIDRVVGGLLRNAWSMANWYNGFCPWQCCSCINLPFWWNVWINNCSYGISSEVFWIGFRSDIVSVRVPYSCMLFRMCRAYADWGSLFLYIVYARGVSLLDPCLSDQCMLYCRFCRTVCICHFYCVLGWCLAF